jgi:predicted nucleic acid-binding protein
MFAIDTNLLVYAHNKDSKLNEGAAAFVTKAMNERDGEGRLSVCLPAQVLTEFVYVITWQRMQKPLSLAEAIRIVQDYVDTGVTIIHQRQTHIQTFLALLATVTTRKNVFDVALAATLKDNGIQGLYTVNVADFKEFDFLKAINPLRLEESQA